MTLPPGPLVKIVIPCYNQAGFLRDAIDSALAQTYPRVDVVVVDDGSTDETPSVGRSYGDRVRYLRQDNAGLAAARNAGILEGRSDFLIFLDSDDYLRANAVALHLDVARAHPTASVFHAGWEYADAEGRVFESHEPLPLDADPFHHLVVDISPPVGAVMVRQSALARAGLFDANLPLQEDWDFWLRLAASGCEFAAVQGTVYVYRRHRLSVSISHPLRMLSEGLTVLEKSLTYHRNCAQCRVIRRRALHDWRNAYYSTMAAEVIGETKGRRLWRRLALVAGASWQNPMIARFVWRRFRAHLRSRFTRA